jgi:hypothetical protein
MHSVSLVVDTRKENEMSYKLFSLLIFKLGASSCEEQQPKQKEIPMKSESLMFSRVLVLFLLLSACSPSEVQVATAIAQTEMAKPTATFTPEPTATPTPEPTQTLTPTMEPTPTLALPDVVQQTYADIEVIFQQDFGDNSNLGAFSPLGWNADGERLFTTSDAILEINGRNSVAFYQDELISLNEAVVLRFRFAPQATFSIGIDGAALGQRIPAFQPGFRSVTMEFRNSPMVLFNSEQNSYPSRFDSDLKLLPEVWYMYTLGFAEGKQFIIKIWDPENPENVLVYQDRVDDMRNTNILIVWVDQNDILQIDDFTIIKFSELK